jgi:hypothetical protein
MQERTGQENIGAHLSDAALFPVQFDDQRGEFLLLPLSLDVLSGAAFLDQRMGLDWRLARRVPWRELHVEKPPAPPALLFHTAFCGSTLLARALQAPPDIVALREPQALLQLATFAEHAPADQVDGPLDAVLQLLSRPWSVGGRCVIKPSNLANNLLPDILRMTGGRAILLYSSLPDFIVSCCKKLPQVQNYTLWAARHLSRGTELIRNLGIPSSHPFHFAEACVLTWYAQMEMYADALSRDVDDRLRSLDFAALLEQPMDVVPECAQWLGLGGDAALWQQNTRTEFRRNAKETTRSFDASARTREHAAASERHAGLIHAALRWANEVVAPVARMPAAWKPLMG